MKLNNMVKFIILVLIVVSCLSILYFIPFSIKEGLNNIDCSKCEIKPSSGNCIQIKDLSYADFGENIQDIDFDVIDTSYVFCPWTPNCDNLNNIISQSKRLELVNNNIETGIKNNVQCCKDDTFYNNNTININMLPQLKHVKNICTRINASNNRINIANRNNNDYLKLRVLCNQTDLSGLYFNKEVKFSGNILKDPNLSIQEIIDYQNILEIKLANTGGETKRNQQVTLLNNELKRLDLTNPDHMNRKIEIQNNLANNFFLSTISNETFQYKLLDIAGSELGESYILQENEFFNCFGNKERIKTFEDISFSASDLKKFNEENYFDIDDNASYKTIQDTMQRPYPSAEDFEMELKNLPPIQKSDNVSASVISNYLNSINSFYLKQFNALIAPRTHAVPHTLQFDNNSLSTKPSTFFVYDGSINTNFDCEPSVTNDDKFKYCGPASYYTEFKP